MYETKLKTQHKLARGENKENIQSYFSVFGPLKKHFNISSPLKHVDIGQYVQFLSPASRRKFRASMEHGHQGAGEIILAVTCADGQAEVSPKTKKPHRFPGRD